MNFQDYILLVPFNLISLGLVHQTMADPLRPFQIIALDEMLSIHKNLHHGGIRRT